MTSEELLRQYGWALAIVIVLLFLLSRAVMRQVRRRAEQRRAAAMEESGDHPQIGPEGFARARKQFILTLALLAIIVIVSILTHLQ